MISERSQFIEALNRKQCMQQRHAARQEEDLEMSTIQIQTIYHETPQQQAITEPIFG